MTRDEAAAAVLPAAQARVARSIRLIGPRGVERVTGRALGARPLLDPALDVALDAGPGERLLRHVGLGSAEHIDVVYRLGPVRAAELANRLDRRFGEQPQNADLVIDAEPASISITNPAPGTLVDRAALRRGLRTLPAELGVPLRPHAPTVGVEQARIAQRVVTRLLDGPREVRFRDATAVLPVATLAALVTTKPQGDTLRVGLDVDGLREELLPRLGRFERQPVDARFVVDGNRVRVVPDVPGRKLDADRIALSLVTNLPARAHLARFLSAQPKLTTEEAQKLRITELVSEFTTNYPCCAPRVTNIKRAATLLDGTIILPGKVFSLNGALGKRTEAKGFVSAPADLQRPLRGCRRRRHQPGRDDALQRSLLLRDQARRPPGAPVLHLALSDGARGDRLLGRARADLPQRLARRDPDEARRERQRRSPCASTPRSSAGA